MKKINKQEEIANKTIAYRQKMLDVFKREGGATLTDMKMAIDPNALQQQLNYHFYILKHNGYIKRGGLVNSTGQRAHRLWVAIKDTYEHKDNLAKTVHAKLSGEEKNKNKYVDGVMTVEMRHVARVPTRTGKVHIGSTMGML